MSFAPVGTLPAVTGPYILTPEKGRPEEWMELEHAGSGTPGILKVEWDPVTGKVRVSGPVVVHNPPVAPAP